MKMAKDGAYALKQYLDYTILNEKLQNSPQVLKPKPLLPCNYIRCPIHSLPFPLFLYHHFKYAPLVPTSLQRILTFPQNNGGEGGCNGLRVRMGYQSLTKSMHIYGIY
jgi:hypothetical protein